MITEPGIYEIPAAEYHADPCVTPSLSSSIARIIIQDSPRHAYAAHPRLNPNYIVPDGERHLDLGSLCHGLMLEGEDRAHVITATKSEGSGKNKIDTGEPVTDYKTKAAREERDSARTQGLFPVLAHEMPEIHAMMAACREQLADSELPDAFTNGKPEQTLVWQEFNGVWCRMRADWIMSDRAEIQDYKTGAMSMHPTQFAKRVVPNGLDIQEAFYRRGFKAVFGIDPIFRFIAQENFPPFALSVNSLTPSLKAYGDERAQYAIDVFGKCLQAQRWPGYPTYVCAAELTSWDERTWQEKEK